MAGAADQYSAFVVTAPGLEPVAAAELAELGIAATVEPGGAAWNATAEQLYAANLELRTASRLIVRAGEFRARTFFELERHARRIEWERFLSPGRPVQLRVTCRKSRLYHEGAVAQRVLEAIGHRTGAAPPEGVALAGDPDDGADEGEGAGAQLFIVRFLHDRCTVSADSSGVLLHQRGYRQAVAKAPLRETLAAAMLRAVGWDGRAPLVDPMCGSGTIPIEAALIARRVAPGLAHRASPRRYSFQEWPAHDAPLWDRLVARAEERALPAAPAPIHASDRDAGAVEAARSNAERAGVAEDIRFSVAAVSAIEPPPGPGSMLVNPPYGVRVGESRPLRNLYAAIGKVARERMPGWEVALLSADRQLDSQIGVRLEEVLSTNNGGIPVRLVRGMVEP